jgi:5-methylcytosine-specific restriction endonuclease McrA
LHAHFRREVSRSPTARLSADQPQSTRSEDQGGALDDYVSCFLSSLHWNPWEQTPLGAGTKRLTRTEARRRHAKAENGSGDAPTQDQSYAGGVGASRVFVLSKDGQPLMPCHPARARELLGKGRAVVVRQVPFLIRLKDRPLAESEVDGQGAVITVRRGLISVELRHRGDQIHLCMQQRAGYRHRRRSANCRYRAPRSNNRTRPTGWLPPSLRHRVDTTVSWTARLCRYAPITEIHVESVAFDTHAMSAGRPLTAAEYRQGTLAGTEIRAYLHAKWNSACAYCDATGVPLNIDHIRPRSRGGSNRISNLVLACVPCNTTKDNTPVEDFLAHQPERLAKILRQAKPPLHDAAAMNATRWQLTVALSGLGRQVHTWSGGRTKWNRSAMGLAKTHTLDALSVGRLDHESGDAIVRFPGQVLVAKTAGRGSYARTTPDRFGFPRLRRARAKQHFGYVTGDLVRATMPTGKWAGTWTGRISVRARGQHSLTTPEGRINVSYWNLRLLQRGDGYGYSVRAEATPSTSRKIG